MLRSDQTIEATALRWGDAFRCLFWSRVGSCQLTPALQTTAACFDVCLDVYAVRSYGRARFGGRCRRNLGTSFGHATDCLVVAMLPVLFFLIHIFGDARLTVPTDSASPFFA